MRSILAPLQLHGLGTPAVESLASYFCRLADVHQVTPAQLFKVVTCEHEYLDSAAGQRIGEQQHREIEFCSHSTRTVMVLKRLEKLTGAQHLICGTLLRLRGVLSANQTGSCTFKRRWCPVCYRERDGVVVEPLAWRIQLVTRCPVHDVRLQDRCARCGSCQRDWQLGATRKLCVKCGATLAVTDSSSAGPTRWEAWSQSQMMRLLGHVATPTSADVEASAVSTFAERAALAATSPALRQLMREELMKSRNRSRKMASIFAIAARWGTTPLDLLLHPEEASTPCLFEYEIDIPSSHRRAFNRQGYWSCERTLRELLKLKDGVLLPNFQDICRKYVVSSSCFRHKNLNLCRRYAMEKRRRAASQRRRQLDIAKKFVAKQLEDLQRSGRQLHPTYLVEQMMREIHVPKAIARSTIRRAQVEMGMARDESVACT